MPIPVGKMAYRSCQEFAAREEVAVGFICNHLSSVREPLSRLALAAEARGCFAELGRFCSGRILSCSGSSDGACCIDSQDTNRGREKTEAASEEGGRLS